MRKRITCYVLLAVMLFQSVMTVSAEPVRGNNGTPWSVRFTNDDEMVSDFTSKAINDTAANMQPGDKMIVEIKLKNENDTTTDWYMTNKVLTSLEDAVTATSGGAYEYYLTYKDSDGKTEELYNSDIVGGERASGGRVGLHEATGALENYFFLDTLAKGQSGTIRLEVVLDGVTQGNAYQNTLADLEMNFAVELRPEDVDNPDNETNKKARNAGVVQTSDDTNMLPYIIAAAVSGIMLLFVGFYGRRERRKTEKEAQ